MLILLLIRSLKVFYFNFNHKVYFILVDNLPEFIFLNSNLQKQKRNQTHLQSYL